MVLVAALAGCVSDEEPNRPEQVAIDALVAFARAPSDETWDELPLGSSVALGLGDDVRARRSSRALREPSAWELSVDRFRGRAGSASALALIASEDGKLRTIRGPHRHCAAASVPPPAEVAELTRIAVQPQDPDGCLDWWTVDAFVDEDGAIRAVTLDLWEP